MKKSIGWKKEERKKTVCIVQYREEKCGKEKRKREKI